MYRSGRLAGITAVLVIAACSGKDSMMTDELRKDLEVASSSNAITLASSQSNAASQVVSSIERTTPPAPRRLATSQRVAKHRPAPRRTPAPVEVQEADVSEEVEPQPIEVASYPIEPSRLPSPRPQPVMTASGGGSDEGRMGGNDSGRIIGGIISVVLRGGGVDGDNCDLHRTGGRGRVHTAVNNRFPVSSRFPVIQGTFPGRVATMPGSGRVRF